LSLNDRIEQVFLRSILTHMGTDMDWAWLIANLPAGVGLGAGFSSKRR
jgi:hypothetical protein